ncbi:hypothetical protein DERP_012705 [Dermatophagoides pteronyssinus]|uniref:Secreted protein n=1 Tax=Dermatophagoides pteronyssinus TaxID=6956 RepID=A0ABQ8IYW4_DERPT|nr:hypothetical protein DERP_012705 [Dermatophagoides pteronyssinus]
MIMMMRESLKIALLGAAAAADAVAKNGNMKQTTKSNTELERVLPAFVPGAGRIDVHFLLVGSKSRHAISGNRVPAMDCTIWFMYFLPSFPHLFSTISSLHLRIRRTAQHISAKQT